MTTLQTIKELVSNARALHDNEALQFLQTLPTPEHVADLKLDLEKTASDPDHRFHASMIVSTKMIEFRDKFKTSPTLRFDAALDDIKHRVEAAFPGAVVGVQIRDLGLAWVEIFVRMDL
jgi:hypothetical protein